MPIDFKALLAQAPAEHYVLEAQNENLRREVERMKRVVLAWDERVIRSGHVRWE